MLVIIRDCVNKNLLDFLLWTDVKEFGHDIKKIKEFPYKAEMGSIECIGYIKAELLP